MNEKFQNKYRIPFARAQWWDYSENSAYFITICTANRECLFGKIIDREMQLSETGEIVALEWEKSFGMRTELLCDVYVIMPNHIHAILRIDIDTLQLQPHGIAYRSPKSVSSFIAGFKSAATTHINQFRNTPKQAVWQTRFHDRIIRDNDEYNRIENYIINNRANWQGDKFFI
jgi:REP element-mobilizing transposase RayT